MIYLFWDIRNDEPEILGEDGEFYFYSEDSVAVSLGLESGRTWTKLNKMQDVTPLNHCDRFDFYSEERDEWIPWASAEMEEVKAVHRAALDPDWEEVV